MFAFVHWKITRMKLEYNRRGGNRLTMTTAIHERIVDSPVELGSGIGGPEGVLLLTASFIALFISRARDMVPRMQMVKVIVNIVQLIFFRIFQPSSANTSHRKQWKSVVR